MDSLLIATFLAAGIILNLTPGADVLFAMASGVSGGWRAAVGASSGIAIGSVLHVILAVLGLSAALASIPHAYDVIRYAGAAYLLWLAVKSWQASAKTPPAASAPTILVAMRRGLWTNVLNPKVALFMLAFLPQFADPTVGPVWHQFVFLGASFVTTGFVITTTYGVLAGILGAMLQPASGIINKLTAVVFGGLAARLVLG